MASKCPPGVICIENMTLGLSILVFVVVAWMATEWHKKQTGGGHAAKASSYFAAPGARRDEPPEIPINMPTRRAAPVHVPINVPTQPGNYSGPATQVGILTGKGEILPLMGKQLIASRDTWQYCTSSNQRSQAQLPVSFKGKSCTSEYGCDSISTGDSVYVEGYNSLFKATIYDRQTPRYIPTI